MKKDGSLDENKNISLHSLRHSYASLLFHFKENLYTIQKLLRHKDIKTTLSVYTHFYNDYKPDSFSSISENFSGKFD